MCEADNAVGAILCGSSHIVRWGWVFKLTTHFLAPHFEINAPCLILFFSLNFILEFHALILSFAISFLYYFLPWTKLCGQK